MRVETERWPLDAVPPRKVLRFSKVELAAFERASKLAARARAVLADESSDMDTLLGEVEHNWLDWRDGIEVE